MRLGPRNPVLLPSLNTPAAVHGLAAIDKGVPAPRSDDALLTHLPGTPIFRRFRRSEGFHGGATRARRCFSRAPTRLPVLRGNAECAPDSALHHLPRPQGLRRSGPVDHQRHADFAHGRNASRKCASAVLFPPRLPRPSRRAAIQFGAFRGGQCAGCSRTLRAGRQCHRHFLLSGNNPGLHCARCTASSLLFPSPPL